MQVPQFNLTRALKDHSNLWSPAWAALLYHEDVFDAARDPLFVGGDPTFGISIRPVDEEPRPVLAADLSTIGICGPANLSDPSVFPLNDPVLVNSNDLIMLAKLGNDFYLLDAIQGINDQLVDTEFAARVVVVRTATGTNSDPTVRQQQTINNIAGSSTSGTGIWSFLKSAHKLAVTPRIIMAPGYTGQMANGVGSITRNIAGTGYTQDISYPITFTLGGPDAVQATGHAFGQANGSLGLVLLDTPGAWYASVPTVTASPPYKHVTAAVVASGGGGSGYTVGDQIFLDNGVVLGVATVTAGAVATVTVVDGGFIQGFEDTPANPQTQISTSGAGVQAMFTLTWAAAGTTATYTVNALSIGANPVCVHLTPVCNQLLGISIIESVGTDRQSDIDWRETMQSERLVALSGGCRVMDPDTSFVVFRPLAPRMAGILVGRDHSTGAPFHSAANQPIQGIIGPNRDIGFALTDDANEAQELLKANIGVVVRGEVGDDFAIASGGFVLISTDTLAEDTLWRFYNVKRGRDFIHLGLLKALRFYLGRYNITGHTIQAILNTMKIFLRDLEADEHILGGEVTFRTEGNSPERIRTGRLEVGFRAEEPPVLTHLVIRSARMRKAIDAMVQDLAAQLNLATV